MATSTETTHRYPRPAAEVLSALVDETYLRARLAALGGAGAELVEHAPAPEGGGKVVLRQGIPGDRLPSFVRSLVSGDLVIERTERWRPAATGASGTVEARVPGAPATIDCAVDLTDEDGGSLARVRLVAKVSVPFVGGKVEKVIVEQVGQLLAAEHAFTVDWLTRGAP
ncbi:DUF2505 domain-containing protein [Streptoalloteichus hindustanus]|nr:DUF2505 domain-containing protein [Streptoalloteichus hindustanus]